MEAAPPPIGTGNVLPKPPQSLIKCSEEELIRYVNQLREGGSDQDVYIFVGRALSYELGRKKRERTARIQEYQRNEYRLKQRLEELQLKNLEEEEKKKQKKDKMKPILNRQDFLTVRSVHLTCLSIRCQLVNQWCRAPLLSVQAQPEDDAH